MRVGEFCNREVVVIEQQSTITEATQVMREYHVGDVVIVNANRGKRIPIGILTDRDVALEIVAKGTDPQAITVGDAMSLELVTVNEDDDLMHVIEVMRDQGIRRVPVVDVENTLVGILTVDDLLDWLSEVLIDLAHLVDQQRRREAKARP